MAHGHTFYQPTKHYNFPSRNETTTIVLVEQVNKHNHE